MKQSVFIEALGRRSTAVCALASALLAVWALIRATSVETAAPLGGALLVGGVGLALAWRRRRRVRTSIAALLPDAPRSTPLAALICALEAKLAAVEHRTGRTHPVTKLPTRERLLARIAADLATGAPHTLGVLHFGEFDQLLAFDGVGAQHALARLAQRIDDAAGEERFVSHVDRATFALWLPKEAGDAAFAAIAYVAGQPIPLGDSVLTPTILTSTVDAARTDVGAPAVADAEQILARAIAALPTPETGPVSASEPRIGDDALRERFTLAQELAQAIEQEQLTMAFQPVVDVAAGRLLGAEALLRWNHPVLGVVSPTRFIPLLERLGLSERYGLWVLNAACREAARWRAEGLTGLRLAVNLSARQVLDPELENKIERTLSRHGLPTQALELELTETAAMADADRTFQLFTRLRARGIGLAIDDFGTGYSSLSYLKNLPFTKLKIDREFVTDVDTRSGSQAICKALLELGRGLQLTVLAEGVETEAETQTLRRLGCTVFQGYHFSRPLAGPDFVAFARNSAWRPRAAAAPLQELSA